MICTSENSKQIFLKIYIYNKSLTKVKKLQPQIFSSILYIKKHKCESFLAFHLSKKEVSPKHKFARAKFAPSLPICRPGSEFRITPAGAHSITFAFRSSERDKIVRVCVPGGSKSRPPTTHSRSVRYAKSRLSARTEAPPPAFAAHIYDGAAIWRCKLLSDMPVVVHTHRGNIIIHVPGLVGC